MYRFKCSTDTIVFFPGFDRNFFHNIKENLKEQQKCQPFFFFRLFLLSGRVISVEIRFSILCHTSDVKHLFDKNVYVKRQSSPVQTDIRIKHTPGIKSKSFGM